MSEQDEIAEIHHTTEPDVTVRDVAEFSFRFDMIDPDVDGTSDDHLSELHAGDDHVHPAWNVEFHGFQGVVGVHERVNGVIHDDEPSTRGWVLGVAVPGVHQGGEVMVPVQEDELLFPQHDE